MKNDNWYLNQIHLHYTKRADFDRDLLTRNISKKSIAFIDEGRLIWTHGKFYNCEAGSWEQITSLISNLNFAKTTNEDGSTTYTLQGKDIEGNDFSTDASFTLLKDIFIESAALIDDGRTLQVIMNNGDIITIDLSKLFQLQDFISSTSVEFVLSPDPEHPTTNTLVSAYARSIQSATNPNVSVVAGPDGVTISTDNATVVVGSNDIFVESENLNLSDDFEVTVPGNVTIQGENGELSIADDVNITSESGNVVITSGDEVTIQGNSVDISSTNGDVVISSSEGNSVKITSPLYLSEEYSDVEQTLDDIYNIIEGGGGGSCDCEAGNGITIEDDTISISTDEYFETTKQYWDN